MGRQDRRYRPFSFPTDDGRGESGQGHGAKQSRTGVARAKVLTFPAANVAISPRPQTKTKPRLARAFIQQRVRRQL